MEAIRKSKRLFLKAKMSSAIDYTDPLNCALHRPPIRYKHDAAGNYEWGAPSCSGCTTGLAERKHYASLENTRYACDLCMDKPTADNMRDSLDAISKYLSSCDKDSWWEMIGCMRELLKLEVDELPPRIAAMVTKDIIVASITNATTNPTGDNVVKAMHMIGAFIRQGGLAEAAEAYCMLRLISKAQCDWY